MTPDNAIKIFKETSALLTGHFLLTSGKHSNQYFQCAKVLQYTNYTTQICEEISNHFKNYEIDTVISPAIGGIIVGAEVGRQLNKKFIFAERETGKMSLRRGFKIEKGEKVLICEDVVTTGGSVFEVMELVKEAGAELIGVGIIVDRSNGKVDFRVPQKSVLKMEVVTYNADECPLCKKGLELVKPGSRKFNKTNLR